MINFLTLLTSAFFISVIPVSQQQTTHIIASHEISMEDRYNNPIVNRVFKDNMLLTLEYMQGIIQNDRLNWKNVENPGAYQIILKPQETFAFHDNVLPQYQGKVSKTTNAHFNSEEGFASDGYLTGDGVCHLASLMDWAAKDAGLDVVAPTNHDFFVIPEIPKQYGVAIFTSPNDTSGSALQNLYITNNKEKPVTFAFAYNGSSLKLSVVEEN